MVQYHFQICNRPWFQQIHFLSWIIHKNIKEDKVIYVIVHSINRVLGHFLWWLFLVSVFSTISNIEDILPVSSYPTVSRGHRGLFTKMMKQLIVIYFQIYCRSSTRRNVNVTYIPVRYPFEYPYIAFILIQMVHSFLHRQIFVYFCSPSGRHIVFIQSCPPQKFEPTTSRISGLHVKWEFLKTLNVFFYNTRITYQF